MVTDDLQAARVVAREYFPTLSDQDLEKVISCTGFPNMWRIPKDGNDADECFRKQLKSVRDFKKAYNVLPDLDDDMDHVYPGAQG